MSTNPRSAAWLVALWWASLVAVVIAVRPVTVADETRYLAVAWEMHRSGDLLLLRLNGGLYGHKPPLLFWLIELGWRTFGVSVWWPRVVTAAFGAGALLLVFRLARRLAPGDTGMLAAMFTATSLVWVAFAGAVMFDVMLAFFVLLALLQVVRAAEGAGWKAWSLAGLAMGFGILAKGPVTLLHVLPLALLAPWWAPESLRQPGARRRWYAGATLAVGVSAVVALAWAIPAAIAGGEAFREEILWRQSAARIVSEDYHAARPVWFHLAVLPALLLPWVLVPAWWRGMAASVRDRGARIVRFVAAWVLPVFVAFSLMKGKQLHYLLPEVAGFGMLAAAGLAGLRSARPHAPLPRIAAIGSAWVAALVIGALLFGPRLLAPYDQAPFAREIGAAQRRAQPVAHFGTYHGEYVFAGRLEAPLQVVHGPDNVLAWAQAQPDGAVVWRTERPMELDGLRPLATRRYRSGQVYLIRSQDVPAFVEAWRRDPNAQAD